CRDPTLPGHHPGRRRLREPASGRHDRGLAGDPELRRLEGIGLVRQEWPRPVLRPAVPARAVPDGDGPGASAGMTDGSPRRNGHANGAATLHSLDELAELDPTVDPPGLFSAPPRHAS